MSAGGRRWLMASPKRSLEKPEQASEPSSQNPDAPTIAGNSPSEAEIAARAYEIYLEHGSRDGNDLDDWLQAERELKKPSS
jgi:Protein of unknown function (DUF2934)